MCIEIALVLQDMLRVPLNERHMWLRRFQKIEHEFTFVLDPMEVAGNDFLAAEDLRRDGRYFEADEKYDSAFLTQLTHLGPSSSASNVLVADTLLGKADNCRELGNLALSKALYAQSSRIYRKVQGIDSEGVVKCSFGIGNVLFDLGLYDEANAVYLQVESQWSRFYGEDSVEYNRVRTVLANTMLQLGLLEKALKYVTPALDYFQDLFEKDMASFDIEWKRQREEDQALNVLDEGKADDIFRFRGHRIEADLVAAHLCMANLMCAGGLFGKAEDHISNAKMTLQRYLNTLRVTKAATGRGEDVVDDEDHFLMAPILQLQAEKLFLTGQLREAGKTIMKVMKFRIRDFSKTANAEYTSFQTTERRQQFFEMYDVFSSETGSRAKGGGGAPVLESNKMNLGGEGEGEEGANIEDDFVNEVVDAEELSLPSYARYNPIIVPPVFVYKNIPVIPHPATIACLVMRGKICVAMAEYNDAKEMLDAGMRMMTKLLPHKQSLRKLSIAFEQANLACLRGSYDESKAMHNTVLQQRLQLCDEFHPDKGSSLLALANIGFTMSMLDDSAQMLAETLKIYKRSYGDQHWMVGVVYASCADVLGGKGLYADSNSYYEKALKIFRATFGDIHPLIARANIGNACNLRDLGTLDFSLTQIEEAIALQSIIFGDEHPAVAHSLALKASVLRAQGKALETKRLLDQAMALQRAKLGKFHPNTVCTLLAMAFNFMDLAKYATSSHIFERANQLLRKCFGKDHSLVAVGLTGQAENFRCKGMYIKAREGHEAALYMRRKLLGEKHPAVAESIYFIGELQLISGKTDDATRSLDDALALQRMALGNAHPDIALTMQALGKVQLAQGKVIEARGTQERTLAMRKAILSAEHPAIGDSQFLIAQIYRKLGRLDQAAALLERCASTVRDTRGARHPLVGETYLLTFFCIIVCGLSVYSLFLCFVLKVR